VALDTSAAAQVQQQQQQQLQQQQDGNRLKGLMIQQQGIWLLLHTACLRHALALLVLPCLAVPAPAQHCLQ
jgi:hypothetical protein